MLLDYATGEQPPRRDMASEGVRTAGLLDLAKLLEYLGNRTSARTLSSIKRGAKADPEGFYSDDGLFVDPRDRLMKDTGPTYQGKPLKQYPSLRALNEEAPTLEQYLNGTEIGDVFGKDLGNIRVGTAELPAGFRAGYTAPQGFVDPATGRFRTVQNGFLALSKDAPSDEIGPLFEHEMQHTFQGLLDMPRGSNLDEMAGPMVEYLQEVGQLRPAQLARIDRAAEMQGSSKPYMRYSATTGEAEARAAERRFANRQGGYDVGVPRESDYLWTHQGPRLQKSMLFDLPQDTQEGFNAWWKNKWTK